MINLFNLLLSCQRIRLPFVFCGVNHLDLKQKSINTSIASSERFIGDSKFDRNRFHPLSLSSLLVSTSDKPTVITVCSFTLADRISTAA